MFSLICCNIIVSPPEILFGQVKVLSSPAWVATQKKKGQVQTLLLNGEICSLPCFLKDALNTFLINGYIGVETFQLDSLVAT